MTAGKAPQDILRVIHNSLSESDSEGTYSILEPFALVLVCGVPDPSHRENKRMRHARLSAHAFIFAVGRVWHTRLP